MADIAHFEAGLLESGYVIDPEGVHSEFVSGKHGQKVDFDKLDDSDPLYGEWIEVTTDYLETSFPNLPTFIIGVANGTNRVVHDVAKRMHGKVVALESYKEKDNDKVLHLQPLAARLIQVVRPELVVIKEDVGTTGSNSVQVAQEALEAGAGEVIVVPTWQRRPQLERLDEAGIEYYPIIAHELETYEPEDCETLPQGFCARGWDFIPRATK